MNADDTDKTDKEEALLRHRESEEKQGRSMLRRYGQELSDNGLGMFWLVYELEGLSDAGVDGLQFTRVIRRLC